MKFLALAITVLFTSTIYAQTAPTLPTTCPANTLCAQITWPANGMASAVTNNAQGLETSGPGLGYVWRCNGGPTNCSAANLANNTAGYWDLIGTVPLTSTAGSAADISISYGASYYYAQTDQWTGGTMSAFNAPFPLQTGQAPQVVTPTPGSAAVVQKP